jgi:16S rRNA (cytosine967-C5)-methyltransferase
MIETIATRVITKYLKKGNMARCLRDILPSSGLSKEDREKTAHIIHDIIRWKKLYESIMESEGVPLTAEGYVNCALNGKQAYASNYPFEIRYSCSSYVASILEQTADWATYLNETPPTTLCVNCNTSSRAEVISVLQKERLPTESSVLETAVLTTSISKYSPVVAQRFAHVMDENSQLIAALAVHLGDSIFDFCAGNGGKSLAMASLSKNTKKLSAYELNESKRAILQQRCTDYDAHVTVIDTPLKKTYDVVLVDAPCTGLGAARRNPEVKYIKEAGTLPATQLGILEEATTHVKKNGYLLYAVCTITPEETYQVIQTFIKNHGFNIKKFHHPSYAKYLQEKKQGVFTAIPRGDLFYLSLLQKQ